MTTIDKELSALGLVMQTAIVEETNPPEIVIKTVDELVDALLEFNLQPETVSFRSDNGIAIVFQDVWKTRYLDIEVCGDGKIIVFTADGFPPNQNYEIWEPESVEQLKNTMTYICDYIQTYKVI